MNNTLDLIGNVFLFINIKIGKNKKCDNDNMWINVFYCGNFDSDNIDQRDQEPPP